MYFARLWPEATLRKGNIQQSEERKRIKTFQIHSDLILLGVSLWLSDCLDIVTRAG